MDGVKCCAIDPPWPHEDWSEKGNLKNPNRGYKSIMTVEEISALGPLLAEVLAQDAVVLLWVYDPLLPAAVDVVRAWGLTWSTVGYYYTKYRTPSMRPHFGTGYWSRGSTEQCWLLKRGEPSPKGHGEPKFQYHPLPERHSEKPEAIYDSMERLCHGPYADLFARRQRPGWLTLGDECPGDGQDIRVSLKQLAGDIKAGRLLDRVRETHQKDELFMPGRCLL